MLVIIFSGLAILPLLVVCFGGLFLRSYMTRRTMLVMMLSGMAVLAAELFYFYQLVHSHIELRQWILISDLMATFPIYSSLSVLIVASVAYLLFEFSRRPKVALAGLGFLLLAGVFIRATAFEAQFNELATNKKMLNEKLTAEQMEQIAAAGSIKEKIVLATRSDLTIDALQKLLQDPSEVIRFYGLVNPAVELKDLEQLKTSDQSSEIRKQATIEIKRRTTQ